MSFGQFKLVEETFLFLIGIVLISIILFSFRTAETRLESASINDQFSSIAEYVLNGIVKIAEFDNASIQLRIPKRISDKIYVISFEGDNLTVYDYENPSIKVSEELRGLEESKTFSGYVFSTAGYIIIKAENNKISIGR